MERVTHHSIETDGISIDDDKCSNNSDMENSESMETLLSYDSEKLTVPMSSFTALYKVNMSFRRQKLQITDETKRIIIQTRNLKSESFYGSLDPSQETPRIQNLSSNIEMSSLSICAILSTAFSYGCIMTTLFLLTLPIICERVEDETAEYYRYTMSKSMALGGFAAIAGLTQLVCPLIGMMSDNCIPHPNYSDLKAMGKRIPYTILGTVLAIIGFSGQIFAASPIHPICSSDDINVQHLSGPIKDDILASDTSEIVLGGAWVLYTIFFFIQNIGLNTVYTVMMALIPDLIPTSQTGMANGMLAMMLVTGSLFGFVMFHTHLEEDVMSMYKMYICVSLFCTFITYIFVLDREIFLRQERHNESIEERVIPNPNEEGLSTAQETVVKQNEKEAKGFCSPSLHSLVYSILIEPLSMKSLSEITAAYSIDRSQNSDFFFVTISRFFYYMGISSQTFFLYFIHDELQQSRDTNDPESAVALLAIVGQTAGALTCYPVGILSDKYFGSRRKPFVYIACVILTVANLSLLKCQTFNEMIIVTICLGAANGIYLTMDTSLAVDTLDEDNSFTEGETSVDNSNVAQMLGVWGVFGFLGSSIGPLCGGCALIMFGKLGFDTDGEGSQKKFFSIFGYIAVFTLSAFYFFCSAMALAFVKKRGV